MISESMKARLHALIDQDYIRERNGKKRLQHQGCREVCR